MPQSNSLKILVVEDESLIAEMIRIMLEDVGHTVPHVAYKMSTAVKALEEEDIDFAVFDINLKGGAEGIELAKIAQNKGIPFMFLTSYSDRGTIDAAKITKPGAFVIKPFTEEELYSGIEMSLLHLSPKTDRVVTLKYGHHNLVLKADEIIFAKADNVYVEVYTTDKRHLIRQSLTAFAKALPGEGFIRVHRSFIINKKFITNHTRSAVYLGEYEVPISRSYKEEVLSKLEA